MTIKIGDRVPDVGLTLAGADGPKPIAARDLFKGKKTALFGLPGAFTPVCSARHLPGYIDTADQFKSKGVDQIVCLSVNDAFVMGAWGKDLGAGDHVIMAADGSADFTKAVGLVLDLTEKGLGVRSKRYSMLVDDGVVRQLNVEDGTGLDVSSAEAMLKQI
jgi:peroxiredoxin